MTRCNLRPNRFVAVLFSLFILGGCASFDAFRQSAIDAQADKDTQAAQAPAQAGDGWGVSRLDTARSTAYLSENEKDIILEINKARTNPPRYAEEYVKPLLSRFSGNDVRLPGEMTVRTNEGPGAVRECIAALKAQGPRSILSVSRALCLAARDHANDTGPRGIVGHRGSDGSMPDDRVRRYTKSLFIGENIAYGFQTARSIVVQLLVDDGVADRGHRENMMRREYGLIGVAIGPHTVYQHLCVIDFAAGH